MTNDVKVYTVNGATAGSSSSLPDWLTRKRAAKGKGKRAAREHVEGTIELIQGFEFPEASNRVKSTRDGHHIIATGTYKPQIRVWDLDQLSQKFERHTDAENVDFVILSDDWTKSIHLQNDRTIELHTQGGHHYRTRIPRFGRSLAYHFPSCDAYVTASGSEIYRLNLDQGRFMNPLVLTDEDNDIPGVNVIDINPAHQLLAFGLEGGGTVQFWDPRSRSSVGALRLPKSRLMQVAIDSAEDLSVTAISSRNDGLSYAIGTSTGHTLLYDIRAMRPYALKDQGYGLPVKNVVWIDGGSKMAGDGMVISADKKVIKIWDRNTPSINFVSITPANDLNDLHHVTGSGLILTANEGIQMATYYIPQLGPAPRWASFLENITEEMEDSVTRSVYEDFKFVERAELKRLGLDHLIGSPTLKPYMHGYFVSLKLYEAACLIANPFAYAEHQEKMVREKMEKMAETRIRTKEPGVKVNKALAEKILREEERAKKREERKRQRREQRGQADMEVDGIEEKERPSVLNDSRFAAVFEDKDYAIDETSREYALLNPSAAAQQRTGARPKTAAEEEEEEDEKSSSDGLGSGSDNDSDSEDSSDAGELNDYDPRNRSDKKNLRFEKPASDPRRSNSNQRRTSNVNFAPIRAHTDRAQLADKNATFGQRRMSGTKKQHSSSILDAHHTADGGMEISWMPSSGQRDGDDMLVSGGRRQKNGKTKRPGVEMFAAGMEKGGDRSSVDLSESERKGRTERRKGLRSGSKNMFRKMDA
ncbi:hypothetical protein C0992_004346 [Termitomyces sp. T32_za158]|nr:hypothetical protein C0992_004346 [Termitomyces sp. T32_za158]